MTGRPVGVSLTGSIGVITGVAAGKAVSRRRLSLVARILLAGFVDLGRAVDGVLDAFPDEGEATFERGFSLSQRRVNGVVDRFEQLGDLMNAEERVSIEDEDQNDLTR